MAVLDFSERDRRLLNETVSRVRHSAPRPLPGDTQFFDNDWNRWFKVDVYGIDRATIGQFNPGERLMGSGLCAPMRIEQVQGEDVRYRLVTTEDPPEFNITVFNRFHVRITGGSIVKATYDPWGFWLLDIEPLRHYKTTGLGIPKATLNEATGAYTWGSAPCAQYVFDPETGESVLSGESDTVWNSAPTKPRTRWMLLRGAMSNVYRRLPPIE
jgi:hypothetical protein